MTRVTIADVATAAGVSKTAVSFAFNNPERLGQTTLDRVLHIAHDLGYTPHPAARALSMRRSGTIGVLIPQRLTTVFVRQGHYAHDPSVVAAYPPADITIDRIGDLVRAVTASDQAH